MNEPSASEPASVTMMSDEQYLAVQSQLAIIEATVLALPIGPFVVRGRRAEVLGPILDPTLWIKNRRALDHVMLVAEAVRCFKDDLIVALRAEHYANLDGVVALRPPAAPE